ncbi:MAG: hypothetical protein WC719_00015 [Patescibacteria group bacterium]|jgi:hypothetical protein
MNKIKTYFKYVLTFGAFIISGSFLIFWAYITFFNGPGAIVHDGREEIAQMKLEASKESDKKVVDYYSTIDNGLFSLTFPSQPVCTEKTNLIEEIKLISNTCILKEENDSRQYLINWGSYPDSIKTHSPKDILEQTLNEKMKITNLEILSQKFIEQQKYLTLEYSTKAVDGIKADGKIIFAGASIYDLVFIRYVDDKNTSDAFFQSFNLK